MSDQAHLSQALDAGRVRRALELDVYRVSDGQYRVQGSEDDYYVQVAPDQLCYCRDAVFRSARCKHLLAALIAAGDPETVGAAASIAPHPAAVRVRASLVEEETDLPADMPLAELIELLDISPGDRQLAGRIVTDPRAEPRHLRRVARISEDESIHITLARSTAAGEDPKLRRALLSHGENVAVICALLPQTEGDEFRAHFRTLVSLGRTEYALRLLEENRFDARSKLTPRDLADLFAHEDQEVRERALVHLSSLGPKREPKPGPEHRELQRAERVVFSRRR